MRTQDTFKQESISHNNIEVILCYNEAFIRQLSCIMHQSQEKEYSWTEVYKCYY